MYVIYIYIYICIYIYIYILFLTAFVQYHSTNDCYTQYSLPLHPFFFPRPGERVLIHAATGGVGLVAVQFAQRVGATIFATAGSPGKVQHLKDMGVKYITSSRDAKDTVRGGDGDGDDLVM